MRERPILFSGPMVRALLDGRKTQTRRVVKPQPPTERDFRGATFGLDRAIADGVKMYSQNDYARLPKHPTDWSLIGSVGVARDAGFPLRYRCPYGAPGDRLWVKETHAIVPRTAYAMSDGVQQTLKPGDDHDAAVYAAGWERSKPGRWRPSIHMPRWASRLTLTITDVRVQRLQDISEADHMPRASSG